MIRAALTTWLALNAAIPVTLGTLRAWHERGYRRNVERVAKSSAELRSDLFDYLMKQDPNGNAVRVYAWGQLSDDRIAEFIGGEL